MTINATNVLCAILSGGACNPSTTKLTVANGTGANAGKATLTLPANTKLSGGVYELLVRTDCGCYFTPTYFKCPPPSVLAPNGYEGDGGVNDPIETCPADPTCPC